MSDFMQPPWPGRRLVGFCGKARRDKTSQNGTLSQHVSIQTMPQEDKTAVCVTSRSSLTLKRASASRQSGEWNDDDFDVLADDFVVGRICKTLTSDIVSRCTPCYPSTEIESTAP
jgi:hypothetical protein